MQTIPKEVLKSLTEVSTPLPWRAHKPFAVGGLWAVGFGPYSDLLLVLSVGGRGLIDCLSGDRLARDSDGDTYDEASETAAGLGPLEGSRIEVAGTGGGISTQRMLPPTSQEGWIVANAMLPASPDQGIFLRTPTGSSDAGWAKIGEAEEVRAIGFSPTGRTLVVAEPHTLHVWSR